LAISVWLPERVRREMLDVRRRHERMVLEGLELHQRLKEWNRELKQIDPYLELVRAREGAAAPGLKPGYYHVLRHNPDAPPTLIVVEGPNGEFREPDSGLFDMLREADLWSDAAADERRRRGEALERARDRQRAREREERKEEFLMRFKALESPGVSMTDARPWTYRVERSKGE
jgi:hypothetical protein